MKIILVGLSGFSSRWVKALFQSKKTTPAALVNRTLSNAESVCKTYGFPLEKCFSNLKEALSHCDADGVLVTLPTIHHFSSVNEALAAGKHVLVEKPLTHTLAEAKKLVALAAKKRKVLGVVSQWRFTPPLQILKRYCSPQGELGKPLSFYVRIHMNRPASYYDLPARRKGRGVLAAQGVHPFDWMLWLLGPAKTGRSLLGTRLHKTENEDTAFAQVAYRNGVMGLYDINHTNQAASELRVEMYFEKGVVRYAMGKGMTLEQGDKVEPIPLPVFDAQGDAVQSQLENFVDACENRGALEVTGRAGLEVMKLVDLLYKNAGK